MFFPLIRILIFRTVLKFQSVNVNYSCCTRTHCRHCFLSDKGRSKLSGRGRLKLSCKGRSKLSGRGDQSCYVGGDESCQVRGDQSCQVKGDHSCHSWVTNVVR